MVDFAFATRSVRSAIAAWLVAIGFVLMVGAPDAAAQDPRFGEVKVPLQVTGEELSGQADLWVMEVYFKPLRLIVVDLTNPKTGKKTPTYVWYMPYRAISRPLQGLNRGERPENERDALVLPPQFVPQFSLLTTDAEVPKLHADQVIPEALAVIQQRERTLFKDSVSIVGDVPDPVPSGAPNETYLSGVAMWTGIDPDADRYTVFMTGFSNGFRRVPSADGTEVVQSKTIEMKYWRPGDKIALKEREIRLDGTPRWIYR